jgi:hypothetical protein
MDSRPVAVHVAYDAHDAESGFNNKVRKVHTVKIYKRAYETANWYGDGDGFVRQMHSIAPHSFDLIAASEYDIEEGRMSTSLNVEGLLIVQR